MTFINIVQSLFLGDSCYKFELKIAKGIQGQHLSKFKDWIKGDIWVMELKGFFWDFIYFSELDFFSFSFLIILLFILFDDDEVMWQDYIICHMKITS